MDAGMKNGFNKKASFRTYSTYAGAISIPAATSLFRIDILPTLNIFPVDTTATRFQTYRCLNIKYQLIPRFNISSTPGTLPVLYRVPVQSSLVPAALPAAFTAFADCTVSCWKNTYSGSFRPLMYQDTAQQT
jgi:hypothetical protein